MKFTIKQFNERFPTSDACLEELKQLRYPEFSCPKCFRKDMLSKISGRPQYACPCGYQVAPLAGTIFHKSSTDLRTWFMTMYMMTQTHSGVSAKAIERTTGVTYKCAWRMMKQIRSLMSEDGKLTGNVEVDETFLAPNQQKDRRLPSGKHNSNAEIVFGAVEKGGAVKVKHIPNMSHGQLLEAVTETVAPGATVHSDGWKTYRSLNNMGYTQNWVDHSHQFINGNVSTQQIENFWSQLKRGMYGVYRHCGTSYLQSYANEYAWRFSNRKSIIPMFELLITRVAV